MASGDQINVSYFLRDDRVGALSPLTRLVFLGMLTITGRGGWMIDRPRRIWALTVPYDKDCDIDAALNELEQAGLIQRDSIQSDGRDSATITIINSHWWFELEDTEDEA